MSTLKIHCVHKYSMTQYGDSTEHKWRFVPFEVSVDIKNYGVSTVPCPSCGRVLKLNIFPGLSLYKAMIKAWNMEDSRSIVRIIWRIFFFLFPLWVAAMVLLPAYREWVAGGPGGFPAVISTIIIVVGGVGAWIRIFGDFIGNKRLKCFIPPSGREFSIGFDERTAPESPGLYGHHIFHKNHSITSDETLQDLQDRIPYYE